MNVFWRQTNFSDRIQEIASGERVPQLMEQAPTDGGYLFETGELPTEVSQAILQAYAGLGEKDPAVAVRSSATAEDLQDASFAGQQETYLNVRGEEALLQAVRRCWASLWSARSIAYRDQMGVSHRGIAMGVVVQVMVPADVSGILFTANPATGIREELLVNASYGLGEAIVSNEVTPDLFRINRKYCSILEQKISQKTVMTVAHRTGTVAAEVEKGKQSQPSLNETQLRELAENGMKIEALFAGQPQDIEWSYANGKLYILQSRPITGLPETPVLPSTAWEPPIKGSKWVRRQIAENMPDPLSRCLMICMCMEGLDVSMDAMQQFMGSPKALEKLYNRPIYGSVNGYAYMRADMNFTPTMMPLVFGAMAAGSLPCCVAAGSNTGRRA
jgi:rifampicin phosphotransferase